MKIQSAFLAPAAAVEDINAQLTVLDAGPVAVLFVRDADGLRICCKTKPGGKSRFVYAESYQALEYLNGKATMGGKYQGKEYFVGIK